MATTQQSDFTIKEGISGVWHYHIVERDSYEALCGARVMDTSMELADWQVPWANQEIPVSWCEKCGHWKVLR